MGAFPPIKEIPVVILAADTSTSTNTVALCTEGAVLAESTIEAGRRHSERLLETIGWLLREALLRMGEVDFLAIGIGPGSFTGLRVGLATFKGLAAGLGRPLVGVPTLDAMGRLIPVPRGVVCPVLDARMNEVFAAAYRWSPRGREKILRDRVCPIEEFVAQLPEPALFTGPGAWLYQERIAAVMPEATFAPAIHRMPRASAVAAEAVALLAAGVSSDASAVTPIYLRKSQAELNRAAASKEE
jgi:tRNA threonylcarbamoyladenosine biosynthesis protein TsaB